jgi:hypothetical protein
MPKNRKETYSDRQSAASRSQKKATADKQLKENSNQSAVENVKPATYKKK